MSRGGGWTRRQAPVVLAPRYPVQSPGQLRHGRAAQAARTGSRQQYISRKEGHVSEQEEAQR